MESKFNIGEYVYFFNKTGFAEGFIVQVILDERSITYLKYSDIKEGNKKERMYLEYKIKGDGHIYTVEECNTYKERKDAINAYNKHLLDIAKDKMVS